MLDRPLRGVRPAWEAAEAVPRELMQEGEYLVDRAGRMTRGVFPARRSGSPAVMYTFEADGADPASAEAPVVLMPNKLLEHMEDTVAERGDEVVFRLSGRVMRYRGANHVLPTMVRLEVVRENLR